MPETPDQITMRLFTEAVGHKHFHELRATKRTDDTFFGVFHLTGRTGEGPAMVHCLSSRLPGHQAFLASLGFGLDGKKIAQPELLAA